MAGRWACCLVRSSTREGESRTTHSSFAKPIEIGLGTTLKPPTSGTLYLRVNDSAARLDDNRGSLTVTIAEATRRTTVMLIAK